MMKTIKNKNLRPGMTLTDGTVIVGVYPSSWKGEVAVTYRRPNGPIRSGLWSTNGTKRVIHPNG